MSPTLTTVAEVAATPYPVTDWTRLERLLIFGSESAAYRAGPPSLALEKAPALRRAIALDGARVVKTITAVSASARAPRNAPALFALAAAASIGSDSTRSLALAALPEVAPASADLFHFAAFIDTMRGWGRGLRRAIADWYLHKPIDELAREVASQPLRHGWRHADLLRLSHPKAEGARDALFRWVMSGDFDHKRPHEIEAGDLRLIYAVEEIRRAATATDAARIVASYGLTPEMVPDRFLDSAEVWSALLERLPLEEMLSNLGHTTAVGLLRPNTEALRLAVSRLGNSWALGRAGLQPLQVLAVSLAYQAGWQPDQTQTWTPVPAIARALDGAFDLSFANVPRTRRRFYLALDVSGSMDHREIPRLPELTPRIAAAAMVLTTTRLDRDLHVGAFSHRMEPLAVSTRDTLRTLIGRTTGLHSGETDCALPILDAAARGIETDVFVVLTGSDIRLGALHPVEALRRYRDQTGIAAKLVVVGMTSSGFNIADPDDGGTLDIIGFDTATPKLIANFATT